MWEKEGKAIVASMLERAEMIQSERVLILDGERTETSSTEV
jgi:hypothetical protein